MEITQDALQNYAHEFVKNLPKQVGESAHTIGLRGNLGSGKTTFTKAVAQELGVQGDVTSPTFVIAQSYDTTHPVFKRLVHIDAYRLDGEAGDTIGFDDYAKNPENLLLVEWPENLPKGVQFPDTAPVLEFETVDENTRRITHHA